MGKTRRGGYVFITWKGDHLPRHVHVFRNGEFVVKWDIERERSMEGHAPRRVRKLIVALKKEGLL